MNEALHLYYEKQHATQEQQTMDDGTKGESPPDPGAGTRNNPGPEKRVFRIRPSMRPIVPLLVLALVVTIVVQVFTIDITQIIVDVTHVMVGWTDDTVGHAILAVRLSGLLPVLAVLGIMLVRMTTIYELTTHRLRIHHGILIRRHDEIGLHRVRDYVTIRTILDMILGTGRIKLHTRDPVFPTFLSAALTGAEEHLGQIRSAAYGYKEETGYREFESW
jgi:membrane protein YdbS with pleckstrin-like domain